MKKSVSSQFENPMVLMVSLVSLEIIVDDIVNLALGVLGG
jgi:hypothetical protein